MSEFKPGDRVMVLGYPDGATVVRVNMVELAVGGHGGAYADPSELTPADPVPDEATLKVRELCAAECEGIFALRNFSDRILDGDSDNTPACIAFANYIRANQLTVERVREALEGLGYDHTAAKLATALHAALTEPRA